MENLPQFPQRPLVSTFGCPVQHLPEDDDPMGLSSQPESVAEWASLPSSDFEEQSRASVDSLSFPVHLDAFSTYRSRSLSNSAEFSPLIASPKSTNRASPIPGFFEARVSSQDLLTVFEDEPFEHDYDQAARRVRRCDGGRDRFVIS
jgi:hypothetical protein